MNRQDRLDLTLLQGVVFLCPSSCAIWGGGLSEQAMRFRALGLGLGISRLRNRVRLRIAAWFGVSGSVRIGSRVRGPKFWDNPMYLSHRSPIMNKLLMPDPLRMKRGAGQRRDQQSMSYSGSRLLLECYIGPNKV